jgi:hypothetical protein
LAHAVALLLTSSRAVAFSFSAFIWAVSSATLINSVGTPG